MLRFGVFIASTSSKRNFSGFVQRDRICYFAGVRKGEVIRIDDAITGFGRGVKRGRPCLIVRIIGDPPDLVYVAPRSASSVFGVEVPARAAPGLNRNGKFATSPLSVDPADIEDAASLGMLEEPHLTRVLEAQESFLMDLG